MTGTKAPNLTGRPEQDLRDKVVLVTGAAKRIGRGIALRLASEGARVVIHYRRSEEDASRTAEECGGAQLFRANLESVAEIGRLFADLEQRMGRLDGLVNNAARFTRFDPLEISEPTGTSSTPSTSKPCFSAARRRAHDADKPAAAGSST